MPDYFKRNSLFHRPTFSETVQPEILEIFTSRPREKRTGEFQSMNLRPDLVLKNFRSYSTRFSKMYAHSTVSTQKTTNQSLETIRQYDATLILN